jgi:hypothetical protein
LVFYPEDSILVIWNQEALLDCWTNLNLVWDQLCSVAPRCAACNLDFITTVTSSLFYKCSLMLNNVFWQKTVIISFTQIVPKLFIAPLRCYGRQSVACDNRMPHWIARLALYCTSYHCIWWNPIIVMIKLK